MPPKNPLIGAPPAEVPLKKAPLVRVITQIRFPAIASVEKSSFIAPLQEGIKHDYPIMRPEVSQGLFVEKGVAETRSNTIWRFFDQKEIWRASLGQNFLALETRDYTSRKDFIDRLRKLLTAFNTHVGTEMVDRLGLRYVDRVTEKDFQHLPSMIRHDILGNLEGIPSSIIRHSIRESLFIIGEESGEMLTRWGYLPPQATVDPTSIEPIDERSWLLDIDAFVPNTRPFDIEVLLRQTQKLGERIYSFFRWAVTDEFLDRYGGKP
ncbi:MAG: hypothetical protein C75L2_00650006 [Leptospirillum sp. Group II 'C75']|uniref:TIGR04255 family protein n=1 Tax=Leptospirillum sp. Group II 'CF-1' TaxID=1660083 RepID=UPI00029CBB65|nr:TIGR04255 family protein [Leptospirillum sp. Group II 'CF-1']AKS23665.1 hypothetical protein ABH19_07800 [Leptospirillum sp. Group II 'CF-1']EIJ75760.1 MAG: hypothetical protein C75L2_00650006 [Leptospirillum sp. Group II 'C75']